MKLLTMLAVFSIFLVGIVVASASPNTCAYSYATGNWFCYPSVTGVGQGGYVTNSTGINGLFTWMNATTQGLALTILIFALWIIMVFAMGTYNILARLMIASFSFSIIASATTIAGWTLLFLPITFGLISVASYAMLVFTTAT